MEGLYFRCIVCAYSDLFVSFDDLEFSHNCPGFQPMGDVLIRSIDNVLSVIANHRLSWRTLIKVCLCHASTAQFENLLGLLQQQWIKRLS